MNRLLPEGRLPVAYLLILVVILGARWISWPAFVTQDTIFITHEAIIGEYTTYHPLLSLLLIKFLAVPFQSYAVYTSIQMLLAAAMFMRALALTEPHRGSWQPMIAALLWGLSLHTWLYLGMIWKDILIAYSLIYLAALIYKLRQADQIDNVSRIDAVLFFFALVFATKLRHGMEFNLLLVPLFIGLSKVLRVKRLRNAYLAAAVSVMSLAFLASSSFVRHDRQQERHDLLLRLTIASQPFLAIVTNRSGYSSDNYAYDEKLAEEVFGRHYKSDYGTDYYNNEIVLSESPSLSYALTAIIARTPRLCVLNIALCISDRIKMMLSTLQPTTRRGGMVFYDIGLRPCSLWKDLSPEMCEIVREYQSSEQPKGLIKIAKLIDEKFVSTPGWIRNLYSWNLVPALAFLCAALICLGPGFRLWWISLFYAAQLLLPFLTAPVNDFRYYYFLAFYLYVFAPMFVIIMLKQLRSYRMVASRSNRS